VVGMMKKIRRPVVVVLGTRAELIKTFPVMLEMQKHNIPYVFVHTGQHRLGHLCELFGVKEPDFTLTRPPQKTSKFFARKMKAGLWAVSVVPMIWNALRRVKGKSYVIYHGDTMTTCAAAIASSRWLNWFKSYGNIHLEAGLRSQSLFEPFPEEISRRICDKFSDVLLAVSKGTENNLRREKQKGRIWNIGNTIVDAAYWAAEKAKKDKVYRPGGSYILMTVHRHENIKSKKRLSKIVEIIASLPMKTILPLHDNTRKKLIDFGLYDKIIANEKVQIVSLKSYVDFIHFLAHCKLLITDGGSIQEESLVFGKPCILLREKTERDEGLVTGLNFLTGLNVAKTKKLVDYCLSKNFKVPKYVNPYGGKGVSAELVKYMLK
jgi:UDP-N-acetylglucosamine 2-epimerase (non-hydrolysing)